MRRNGLSGIRAGFGSLPVARMGPSPLLDSGDLIGSAEDIAITILAEPAALAGGLAGLAAVQLGAVALAVRGARIREEELTATKALPATWPTAHRESNGPRAREGRTPKKTLWKKTDREEGRRASGRRAGRKPHGRKRNFRPPQSHHFHSAPHRIRDVYLFIIHGHACPASGYDCALKESKFSDPSVLGDREFALRACRGL